MRKSFSLLARNLTVTSIMGSSNTKSMKVTTTTAASPAVKSKCQAPCNPSSEFVEAIVCQEGDLADNQMREFDLQGEGKVLLVKQGGKFSAIGNKCSHYGASLVNGALGDGRVRCPWHGACFNIESGDIEDFPGLDSVQSFMVKVEAGAVKVRARKTELTNHKRVRGMVKRDLINLATYVVVGGGAAGNCCAETLRQEGFSGRLVLVSQEKHLPYDRIKLSKAPDTPAEIILLRTPDFYKDNDIEILCDTSVTSLDTSSKTFTLCNGDVLKYNSAFLATGSTPRRGDVPGSNLKNVFVLRNVDQANELASKVTPETDVVILGASFIGMEVATYCVTRLARSVTVIARDSVPFEKALGEQVGGAILKVYQEKGVKFEFNTGVKSFTGEEKTVEGDGEPTVGEVVIETILSDDRVLPSTLVVLGIGSVPCTDYLKNSGLDLHADGTVIVNEFLETSAKGVYAGGDIAHAPVLGTRASIGHWGLAHYHGHKAAQNMSGRRSKINTVPFFWTMFFGKSIRYAGYAAGFDSIVVDGDLDSFKFIAYYCVEDKVVAVATANRDPVAAKFAELLDQCKVLTKSSVESDPDAWLK